MGRRRLIQKWVPWIFDTLDRMGQPNKIKMKDYFPCHEFLVLSGQRADLPITLDVFDKIHRHKNELNPIRAKLGIPVHITSGYRPVWWEKVRDRNGMSEHTYKGDGAVDLVCLDMRKLLMELSKSGYTRIVFYPVKNFIHCDYKFPERGKRFFVGPEWKEKKLKELIKLIQ